jgi:hypothetical protein
LVTLLMLSAFPARSAAAGPPDWLPRYELDMDLDTTAGVAHIRQRATWTNPTTSPTRQLVFNAHSRYVVPKDQVGFMAKTLEILRVNASDVLGVKDPPLEIHRITLEGPEPVDLPFRYEGDTHTTLTVDLPRAVGGGESVTVVLEMTFTLPPKQGRWGQWRGVTYLSNWLPVFAVYGPLPEPPPLDPPPPTPLGPPGPVWQPTPFVPWHQPFFNEAAWYRVRLTLPADQKVACSGTVIHCECLPGGRKLLDIESLPVRDFAILCSALYHEHCGEVEVAADRPPVRIRVLALEEHEFYGREIVSMVRTALATYSRWFGPYPYPEFTIAESYFGWNGNECGALVMIDERIFGMPHLARGFVESLVSHEVCHQWWYNQIGTNGYEETWMDEGFATYFSHRLLNQTVGKNNNLMTYPGWLEWLPNIRREDYRCYGMYGTFGRGENGPTVQAMPGFGHVVNLFSLAYDKGSRIVGMIEERLGEDAFLAFSRRIFQRYQYRILRISDYRHELEDFTGQRWDKFFACWLYGPGICDWAIDKVEVHAPPCCRLSKPGPGCPPGANPAATHVTVWVEQRGECIEQTMLGIALPGRDGYCLRVPILPSSDSYELEDLHARVQFLEVHGAKCRVRVDLELPEEPEQMAIDPDQVLVDREPANNFWKKPIRWRVTPMYTFLEETDLTCAYDRWNVIVGPWIYGTAYDDAWYTRSTMLGFRAGLYRTQQFSGGVYTGYRTDFRDVVAGVDGLIDHWPDSPFQVGFNAERRLSEFYHGDAHAMRAVLFARWVLKYGSSLYLPPMEYLESFVSYQDNFLPFNANPNIKGERFDQLSTAGLHYRLDYLTPYWDPEGGLRFDVYSQGGATGIPEMVGMGMLSSQFSYVDSLPDFSESLVDYPLMHQILGPGLRYLGDTRLAVRAFGGTSVPCRGEFYTMGGSLLFRGFDLAQRQGSNVWVGSAEWRLPLAKGLNLDACDHIFGLRNVFAALFYDVGDTYVQGHQVGPVAHGVGAGLRLDVSWFGIVERTTLRFDVAKTLNATTPIQVWFGVGVPF